MIRIFSLLLAGLILLSGSCAKNETIRANVRKKINDFIGLGNTDYKRGKFKTAEVYFDQALDEAFAVDSYADAVYVLQALADVNMRQDNLAMASVFLNRANQIARDEGVSQYLFLLSLRSGKLTERAMQDSNSLLTAYKQFQKASDNARTDDEKADVWQAMGVNLKKQGKNKEAMALIQKSLAINLAQQDFDSLGDNYFNLAEISLSLGDPKAALEYQLKSLQCDKTSENSSGIAENLRRVAQIYQKLGNDDRALNFYYRSASAFNTLGLDAKTKQVVEQIESISRKLGKPLLYYGNPQISTNTSSRQKTNAVPLVQAIDPVIPDAAAISNTAVSNIPITNL